MNPDRSDYDLVVIGSGPAGQKGAIAAAKMNQRVAIIERKLDQIGGVSLHWGTIPSKTIREAIIHLTGYRHRNVFEQRYAAKRTVQMTELKKKLAQVVENELAIIHDQLTRNSVDVFQGQASFIDPHTLVVDHGQGTAELRGKRFLIATGSKPIRPDHIPFDGRQVFDSNEILSLEHIPKSMIVVGGGVVGIEYALMFATLGVKVTVVDRRRELLAFCDREVIETLMFNARSMGVIFRLGESVANVSVDNHRRVVVELESRKQLYAEIMLFSAGRCSDVDHLNLAAAGLESDESGKLTCDANHCTNVEHIFAVGDVIGFPALASTSMEQGRKAVHAMFGEPFVSPQHLPYGLFTMPEISMIGMTEQQLTDNRIPYEFGISHFREIARGQINGTEFGFLKLLFDPDSRLLLGAHCIGDMATELIHIAQTVMCLGGTIDYLRDTVFNYPTMAECYKVAALDGINRLHLGSPAVQSLHEVDLANSPVVLATT